MNDVVLSRDSVFFILFSSLYRPFKFIDAENFVLFFQNDLLSRLYFNFNSSVYATSAHEKKIDKDRRR